MIICDENIKLNLFLNNKEYYNVSFDELESLLSSYKDKLKNSLKPKEIVSIDNAYVYFTDDNKKNKFYCKIYKTSCGPDVWILLLIDEIEGYALYENPVTNKHELAWYRTDLIEPLSEENERELITCYVPKKSN